MARGPAPPPPECVLPPSSVERFKTTPWLPTGGWRSKGRFFGLRLGLQIEEQRREFRPVATGHTPANWRTIRRYRWATRAELIEIAEYMHQERIRDFAGKIPMPRRVFPPAPIEVRGLCTARELTKTEAKHHHLRCAQILRDAGADETDFELRFHLREAEANRVWDDQ